MIYYSKILKDHGLYSEDFFYIINSPIRLNYTQWISNPDLEIQGLRMKK
jgi:hypothetical protein